MPSTFWDWTTYVLISIVVIVGTFSLISYFQTKKSLVRLSTEQFREHMRKGQLVDVRTKKEFDGGHINGARNINASTIAREYQKLRKDQPIYLYCNSGKRSTRAAIYLKSKGYNEIFELKGGLKNWTGSLK